MSESIKVLYIDDEEVNLFIFKELLNEDYEIHTALSGEEGLRILETEKDIAHVISDYRMSPMSGLQFITKAREKHPNLKYFLLSGYTEDDTIRNALDKGLIDAYWAKPADFELIHRALNPSS
mgnify:CR=1 FL=1